MARARKRLEGAVRDLLEKKQDKPRLFPGALGAYVDGVKTIKVAGRSDFVYVRLRTSTSEVIEAFNDAVGLHFDLPVLVYRDPLAKHLWRIYARDIGQYEDWGGASYLPPHALSHSFVGGTGGGSDIVWAQKRQLMPLLGRPIVSGTMGVWVEPDYYYWNDSYHYWPGSGTASLAALKPTGAHNGRFVTIYLDGDAGILRTLNGPEFDIIYPPPDPSLYIQPVSGSMGIPIVAAFLITGTSTISWGELFDLREIVSPPDSVCSYPCTGTFVLMDEGVIQGSAPILNFLGAGVTAAIVGGRADVTIPGGGSVPCTGTFVLQDEGVTQGSVPILNFIGAGVTAAIAGGRADVTIPGGGSVPCTGTVVVQDEGVIQGSVPILDFVGAGVTAAVAGTKATVTVPGAYSQGARVTNSAHISIPNITTTKLTFDTEYFDTDGIHSLVGNTGRLTCVTAGKYWIGFNILFFPGAGNIRSCQILLNNVDIIGRIDLTPPGAGYGGIICGGVTWDLAATDYVELQVYQDSGGALNVLSAAKYSPDFMMQRVG